MGVGKAIIQMMQQKASIINFDLVLQLSSSPVSGCGHRKVPLPRNGDRTQCENGGLCSSDLPELTVSPVSYLRTSGLQVHGRSAIPVALRRISHVVHASYTRIRSIEEDFVLVVNLGYRSEYLTIAIFSSSDLRLLDTYVQQILGSYLCDSLSLKFTLHFRTSLLDFAFDPSL